MLSPIAQIFLYYLKRQDPKSFTRFYNEFREEDHPRDKDGQFTSKGNSAEDQPQSKITKEFLGEEFTGFKGKDAINKLLKEKRGYIRDAFSREDIGGITLVWGDKTVGLAHIIKQREKQNINIKDFLSDLSDVIEKGEFLRTNEKGRFEIKLDNKFAIIEPEFTNKSLTFLLTAYKRRK